MRQNCVASRYDRARLTLYRITVRRTFFLCFNAKKTSCNSVRIVPPDYSSGARGRHDLSRRAATGRSPAEILGSNPTEGMDICLL